MKVTSKTDTHGITALEVELPNGESIVIVAWVSDLDGVNVVQIDTTAGAGRVRVNLNDAPVWDGNPATDEHPGAFFDVS